MFTSDEIAFGAAVISLLSLGTAYIAFIESKRAIEYQSNFQALFTLEGTLDIETLALHNVDPSILTDNHITINEFRYIVQSFRAGAMFYVLNQKQRKLTAYRKNLLNNPKVKIVYCKILKDKFLDHSRIGPLIDEYYQSQEYHINNISNQEPV